MFRFPSPSTRKVGSVGRSNKKRIKKWFQSNTISLNWKPFYFHWNFQKYGSVMFSLNGTTVLWKKVGRSGDGKQFIGMALYHIFVFAIVMIKAINHVTSSFVIVQWKTWGLGVQGIYVSSPDFVLFRLLNSSCPRVSCDWTVFTRFTAHFLERYISLGSVWR